MWYPDKSVNGVPLVFVVGAIHNTVAVPLFAVATVIVKLGSATVVVPSLTLTMILEKTPTLPVAGVPDSWPVVVLNFAQLGRLWMLYTSDVPVPAVVAGAKA